MNQTIYFRRTIAMMGSFLFVLLASAQDGKLPTQRDNTDRSKARTEHMARELELNADQTAKIQAIKEHYHARMEKVRVMEDKEQRQQAMRELHSTRENEIRSVLTPAQDARWGELQAERKAKMQQRRADSRQRPMHNGQGPRKEQAPRQPMKDPQN